MITRKGQPDRRQIVNAERMRKLNADPAFAKANAERMRKLHADPAFAKANAAAVSKAQKKRWAEWRKEHRR